MIRILNKRMVNHRGRADIMHTIVNKVLTYKIKEDTDGQGNSSLDKKKRVKVKLSL
jgi:hypothetical protein